MIPFNESVYFCRCCISSVANGRTGPSDGHNGREAIVGRPRRLLVERLRRTANRSHILLFPFVVVDLIGQVGGSLSCILDY